MGDVFILKVSFSRENVAVVSPDFADIFRIFCELVSLNFRAFRNGTLFGNMEGRFVVLEVHRDTAVGKLRFTFLGFFRALFLKV